MILRGCFLRDASSFFLRPTETIALKIPTTGFFCREKLAFLDFLMKNQFHN